MVLFPLHGTPINVHLFAPFEDGLVQNRTAKRKGVFFMCMATRAVFFELILSPSTSDFLLALRKFISLYRQLKVIHFENGTNFLVLKGSYKRQSRKCMQMKPFPPFPPDSTPKIFLKAKSDFSFVRS